MKNQRDDSRDFMPTNSGVGIVFANPQYEEDDYRHLKAFAIPGPGDEPLTEIDLSGWMPYRNDKPRFIDTWNLGR